MAVQAPQPAPRVFVDPLVASNPITLRVLGLCSALAVTSSVLPALIMSAAVIAVLVFANISVSLLRHVIPSTIRLIIEVTLIATAVIVVDEVLKAFMPEVSAVLSVFVGLIITNCIVLARVESFAMQNGVWASTLDALGNGVGYMVAAKTMMALTPKPFEELHNKHVKDKGYDCSWCHGFSRPERGLRMP